MSPRPQSQNADVAAAVRALSAAEKRLNELLPRLDDLTSQVEGARREVDAALAALRTATGSLRVIGSDSAPIDSPPFSLDTPSPQALAETTDLRLKQAPNLAETSEMPPIPPREDTPPPDSLIRFSCAHCGARLSAAAKYVGKSATCRCGKRSTIPARSTREAGAKP